MFEITLFRANLLLASISLVLLSVVLIRPLFHVIISLSIWNKEKIMMSWRCPSGLWIASNQGKIQLRLLIALFLLVGGYLLFAYASEAVGMSFLTMGFVLLYLALELFIPPSYAITEEGLIIRTLDTVRLLFSPGRNYFVSWRRVVKVLHSDEGWILHAVRDAKEVDPLFHKHKFRLHKVIVPPSPINETKIDRFMRIQVHRTLQRIEGLEDNA